MGSRKLYAVQETQVKPVKQEKGKQRRPVIHISDSDDDEFEPLPKRNKESCDAIEHLLSEVRDMRKDVNHLFQVDKCSHIPVGLHKILHDTFRCCICQSSPMTPPVIFARCCKSLIGCSACADAWYGGEEGVVRTCPKCRSERAFADTMVFRGMDDLIQVVHPLHSKLPWIWDQFSLITLDLYCRCRLLLTPNLQLIDCNQTPTVFIHISSALLTPYSLPTLLLIRFFFLMHVNGMY